MATDKTWIGGTDDDFANANNWDPTGVPVSTDRIYCNHRATRSIANNLNQSAKTFARWVFTPGFRNYTVGTAASPMQCNITDLDIQSSHREIALTGTLANINIDTPIIEANKLTLDAAFTHLNHRAGHVHLVGSKQAAASSGIYSCNRLHLDAPAAGGDAIMVIDSTYDLTTNTTRVHVQGSDFSCGANISSLLLAAGECKLTDSATLAALEMTAGTFKWQGDGTIALAYCLGGYFDASDDGEYDIPKTLTTAVMMGDAQMDFSKAVGCTITNPVRVLGAHQPIFPSGRVLSAA